MHSISSNSSSFASFGVDFRSVPDALPRGRGSAGNFAAFGLMRQLAALRPPGDNLLITWQYSLLSRVSTV